MLLRNQSIPIRSLPGVREHLRALRGHPGMPMIDVIAQDDFGESPLARTLFRDDAPLETIRLLLYHGARVNIQDCGGDTTLHAFVQSYVESEHPNYRLDREILRFLMEYGGNPNLPNKQGDTALMCAQEFQRPDIVALMRHVHVHQ